MKTLKGLVLLMMLFFAFTAIAQNNVFVDDIYAPKSRKTEPVVEKVKVVPVKQQEIPVVVETTTVSDDRDVDEYNRRYTDVDVSEGEYDEATVYVDGELTERIVRFHDPSKITIIGADNMNIRFDGDGYVIAFDEPVDNQPYVNFAFGGGFYPWYGWHNPWVVSSWHRPWGWSSWGWHDPWGWNSWGWHDPWCWHNSWGWNSWGWHNSWGGSWGGWSGQGFVHRPQISHGPRTSARQGNYRDGTRSSSSVRGSSGRQSSDRVTTAPNSRTRTSESSSVRSNASRSNNSYSTPSTRSSSNDSNSRVSNSSRSSDSSRSSSSNSGSYSSGSSSSRSSSSSGSYSSGDGSSRSSSSGGGGGRSSGGGRR